MQAHIGLLIVDVQEGFVAAGTDHIPGIVEELQEGYRHVAASRFVNHVNSPHRRFLDWNRFLPDTSEVELAFKPVSRAFVLDKPHYSAVSYDLLRWVHLNGISEVHVCGIDTEICVLTSATASVRSLDQASCPGVGVCIWRRRGGRPCSRDWSRCGV